ncbi:MAG: nucleotidyltransferase domain-containing protein [Cyclobacteriaceae bacterium]|nr:nucleotidyltransferase domain-containing protein [Cytophagales bacterium]MCZ8329167.1 nucleotidyltransferase domain-containing protein [Cyclobacteriaceae bacterium]
MNNLVLPSEKYNLLTTITNELKQLKGIKAVVLGGSHATHMAHEKSDLDIGIYYHPDKPFEITDIQTLAKKISNNNQPVVTGFYEWGPYVNGGAWIETDICQVDFIYKNLNQIKEAIDQAEKGIWDINYEQQPPFGFSTLTFLAETFYCIPLFENTNEIKTLKERVKNYPQKLKHAVVQQCLWAAEFSIWQGENFADKNDLYATYGCITRALHKIIFALFSLNELYPMGDKNALPIIERCAVKPTHLTKRVNEVLTFNYTLPKERMVHLKKLFSDVTELAQGLYTPYFKL